MLLRQFFRIGVPEDIKTLGVGLHQAILDAIVDHFDKVARAGWTAVNVAILSGAARDPLTPRRALDIPTPWCQGFEDGGEMRHGLIGSTNHHTVAAIDPPDATTGAHIDIVNAFRLQDFGTTYIVFEHRVATINDNVTTLQQPTQLVHASLRDFSRRQHQPHSLRRTQFTDQVCHGRGTYGALPNIPRHRLRVTVVYDQLVPAAHAAFCHVAAHAT